MSVILCTSELLREKNKKFLTFYFTEETISLTFEVSKLFFII